MPKEPLYPHIPKKKAVLFPHQQAIDIHVYSVPDWPEVKGVYVGGCVARGPGSSFRAKAHAHNFKDDQWFGWICVRSLKRVGETAGQVITKPSRLLIHERAHLLTPNHCHDDTWRKKMKELGQPLPKQYEKKERYSTGTWLVRRWCPKCREWVDTCPPFQGCPRCRSVTVNKEA